MENEQRFDPLAPGLSDEAATAILRAVAALDDAYPWVSHWIGGAQTSLPLLVRAAREALNDLALHETAPSTLDASNRRVRAERLANLPILPLPISSDLLA